MNRLRSLISGTVRAKRIIVTKLTAPDVQKKYSHHEGFPQPFDNMPFNITNRYVATAFWCVFFGIGLWTPFAILWYSMAKKTL